jgi:hypothetical protein
MEILLTLDDTQGEVSVARLTTPAETDALLQLFQEIAVEQCWQPGESLQSTPPHAVHFALCQSANLIGGLQLVRPDAEGKLPCQQVWPEVSLPDAPAHVTILGLTAEHRGNPALFWSLCQELWCYCTDQKIRSLLLEATPRMAALYKRMGLPLQVISDARVHWGEPCLLASVDIVTVAGTVVLRARHSPLFRQLVMNSLQPFA